VGPPTPAGPALFLCVSFCSQTGCGAENTFFVPFVSVPDKSPRKVGVWFTEFMVCLGFTWASFLFPETQLLISLVVKNIIH